MAFGVGSAGDVAGHSRAISQRPRASQIALWDCSVVQFKPALTWYSMTTFSPSQRPCHVTAMLTVPLTVNSESIITTKYFLNIHRYSLLRISSPMVVSDKTKNPTPQSFHNNLKSQ